MTPLQRILIVASLAAPLLSSPAAPGALARIAAVAPVFKLTLPQQQQVAALARRAALVRIEKPEPNWSVEGHGSCAWASTMNLLRWQGHPEEADWIRRNCGGGAGPAEIYPQLDKAGISYAETRTGDESFLEWACHTRRGACVAVSNGSHMLNLVGLDAEKAYCVGNNDGLYVFERPRAEFLQDWKTGPAKSCAGWAFTIVGTPPPPPPWIIRKESGP